MHINSQNKIMCNRKSGLHYSEISGKGVTAGVGHIVDCKRWAEKMGQDEKSWGFLGEKGAVKKDRGEVRFVVQCKATS